MECEDIAIIKKQCCAVTEQNLICCSKLITPRKAYWDKLIHENF